jgi:predicted SPOUT superfamily RNA methylase MTH1
LREKTAKVGLIARACAIFGVREIILYADDARRDQREDLKFSELILNFVETPQYLRKRMFRLTPLLRFTGILPPLQTPHHDVPHSIRESKVGDIRDGIVTGRLDGALAVDVGLDRSVGCPGNLPTGSRVTVRLTSVGKNLGGEIVEWSKISIYWGYRVRTPKSGLGSLLEKEKYDLTIGTSRYGLQIVDVWPKISTSLKNRGSVLVAFGSPRMGLREILGQEGKKPEDVFEFFVNTVPGQGVATVRTEEAVLISLGILNAMRLE